MAEPRWLDEREARAWRGFLRMQSELRRVARQLQQEAGLSAADYEVLVSLSEAPGGRLRVFELGGATQWEKSRLSHHLTRMEHRGLVRRMPCPTDNRGANVVLTDGPSAIEAAAPRHVEHVRKLHRRAHARAARCAGRHLRGRARRLDDQVADDG